MRTDVSDDIFRGLVQVLLNLTVVLVSCVVVADLWSWFAVPLFPALPVLTPLHVLGLRMVVRGLVGGRSWRDVELASALSKKYITDGPWVQAMFYPFSTGLAWGILWVLGLAVRDYGHLLPLVW